MPSGDCQTAAEAMTDAGERQLPEPALSTTESALHANIKAKGQHAYYFAHAPRQTGEEPAPLPVHVPLEVTPVQASEIIVSINSGYQFLDDGDVVKVYLPLEGVAAKLAAAATAQQQSGDTSVDQASGVQCEYASQSLLVNVRGYEEGRTLRFTVKELAGTVLPDQCKHKVLANKVVIMLHKDEKQRWSKLTKN